MNVLVVYAHHEPSSFTSALKNVSLEALEGDGHTVVLSDLYAQGFHAPAENYDFTVRTGDHFNYMQEQKNAALHEWAYSPDIVEELQKVHEADFVIFHFPIWWFSAPAIMKGWFDRVLTMGVAWDGHGQSYEQGLMRGKRAMVVVTTSSPADHYQPGGRHRATIDVVLHHILHGTLAFCGMDVLQPYVVFDILNKTPEQRQQVLDLYREHVRKSTVNPEFFSRYLAPGA